MRFLVLLFLILVVGIFSGCENERKPVETEQLIGNKKMLRDKMIEDCLSDIPIFRKANSIFPENYKYISYFDGTRGTPQFNMEIFLYQRYKGHLKSNLVFNEDMTAVVSYSPVELYLNEVSEIKMLSGGRIRTVTNGLHVRVDPDDLEKVLENNGDFSILDLDLDEDAPVPNFSMIIETN